MALFPKIARKKSSDPIQEQLRTHKDKWNKDATEFISKVIAFKRALNGRGDSHYSLPPSSIKDPFPSSFSSFLNSLSQNFESLAQEALNIQKEQAEYSAKRKKPNLKKASNNNYFIKIKENTLPTLLAISAEEQERGLMGCDWPPPIMSFVYETPQINKFWMKNTPSPLDIIFSLNGKITSIHKGEPFSTQLIGPNHESDLIVELPYGTCEKLNVSVGDDLFIIRDDSPTVNQKSAESNLSVNQIKSLFDDGIELQNKLSPRITKIMGPEKDYQKIRKL